MYVKAVKASNFRCFGAMNAQLEYPGRETRSKSDALPNVTLLLGSNGAGKTTILKAVALAVLAPVIRDSGYRPYFLIRRENGEPAAEKAAVKCSMELQNQDFGPRYKPDLHNPSYSARIRVQGTYESIRPSTNTPRVGEIFDDESPAFFLVGYGATRRVENVEHLDSQMRKRRGLRYQRVAGLFEEYITLFPLGAWLPELKSSSKARFAEIEGLFNELLPSETRFTGRVEDYEPIFDHRGVKLPFGALSDGYRAYSGLVGDLLYHLQLSCPRDQKLTDMTGVVLVDDIDLHLHPSWQRTVVPDLARTFPRLQFVLTSHSPLVVGTLHSKNIRLVEDAEVKEYHERVHGLSADQILTSSYFNLPTSRSPDAEAKLAGLSQEVARRGDPKAAVMFLRELAGKSDGAEG